ncbi:glycerate dehydrogenase HPR, peroxisomal-like isoform X2 [Salvia hispanica]|uniref:glycerate dehydrogenase HPR, peroxisomal-like isoform X2 n=1 Tax=Salvia hispanica TaxID=49212 RepID=UPI002009C9FD|nr:glycerate dehydrogenase HPR, peroxisomal-like isoform X2 [Salvia hispanica]
MLIWNTCRSILQLPSIVHCKLPFHGYNKVDVDAANKYGVAVGKSPVEGFKMNLIYFDLYQSTRLEKFVTAYGYFLKANGEATTYHLVNKERMVKMKKASCNGAGESGYVYG